MNSKKRFVNLKLTIFGENFGLDTAVEKKPCSLMHSYYVYSMVTMIQTSDK